MTQRDPLQGSSTTNTPDLCSTLLLLLLLLLLSVRDLTTLTNPISSSSSSSSSLCCSIRQLHYCRVHCLQQQLQQWHAGIQWCCDLCRMLL
jgi:hypothetical protein